jgi:DNA transformation protein
MNRIDIAELFAAFGAVDVRRMFGGFGVYADGVMFAIVHDGVIYLKADEASRIAFEREGQGAFTYTARGKRVALSYWRIPDRLSDDPDELAAWAKTALAVAQRAKAAKPRAKARRGRTGSG